MGAALITALDLVSIIIPCYNQAPFLGEALESARGQTHPHLEVLVVDDGSTDKTPEVARRFAGVRYIRQANRGLAAARNTGLAHSTGRYLVFLDADDRLLPHAVEIGLGTLAAHPECVCVAGHYRLIAADGSVLDQWQRQAVDGDSYAALLRRNHIGMHATVLYSREAFGEVGTFNLSLRACEDYDLLLRIARHHPIYCYDAVVAEYRRHSGNMSLDPVLMLRTALAVHRAQWEIARHDSRHEEALREGRAFSQEFYGGQLVESIRARMRAPEQIWSVMRDLMVLRVYYPKGFAASYREVTRELIRAWALPDRMGRGLQRVGRGLRRIGRRVLPAPVRGWIRRWRRR